MFCDLSDRNPDLTLLFERGVLHVGGQELHFVHCHRYDNAGFGFVVFLLILHLRQSGTWGRTPKEGFPKSFNKPVKTLRDFFFFRVSMIYGTGGIVTVSLFITTGTTWVIKIIEKYSSHFLPQSFEVCSHNFLPRYRKSGLFVGATVQDVTRLFWTMAVTEINR